MRQDTATPVDDSVAERTDEELMRAIAGRDEAAFAALYDRYASVVYALARRVLRRDSDAQAVISDVFWEIWRRAERFNPERGSARTYLLTLARSRAVDALRSRSIRRQREAEAGRANDERWSDGAGSTDPSATVVVDEDRKAVVAAMAELNESQQHTLRLAYFGGLTHREIADELGMPLGSVKTYIRQGLIKLRRALEGATPVRRDS